MDVGISYGLVCCAAVLTYKLRVPWNRLAAVGLVGTLGLIAITHGSFTDWGHLAAELIGLALYPITRASDVQNRIRDPIWRVGPRPARGD